MIDLMKHVLEECKLEQGDIVILRIAGEPQRFVFRIPAIQAERIRKAHAYANQKAQANQYVVFHETGEKR